MPDRMGPLRKSRFILNLGGGPAASIKGFSKVDMPKMETQVVNYREGNDPTYHRQLWGRTKYNNVTLERGTKKGDKKLHDWYKLVRNGDMKAARQTVKIKLMDEQKQEQAKWELRQAWPKDYQPPSMDANTSGGNGAVALEKVTIVYNEFNRKK